MKKLTLFLSLLIFATAPLFSQPCAVKTDSLKGKYTGDCKDEIASGYGTATGVDSYTGNFKNGVPDGEGKYTWKNGSWYEGTFRKGLPEGNGTMHKLSADGHDSTMDLKGFWKKGNYLGKYEKPYVISTMTNNVSDVSVRKTKSGQPEITITVKSTTGGAVTTTTANQGPEGGAYLPKPKLTGIQIVQGNFEQQVSDENSSPMNNKYVIRNITFPFYAILSFATPGGSRLPVERVGIELYEGCNWGIQVTIDN